jgi:hypothetical protein
MKNPKFRLLILLAISITVLQSCNKDDDSFQLEEEAPIVSNATTQLIVDWNAFWLELDRYTSGMRPNSTARALGYIHLAGYEAVAPDMDGYRSNSNRLQGFNINQSEKADNVDLNLALNTTYALVFDHFMFSVTNNKKAGIEVLQNQKAAELSQGLTDAAIENSIDWGTYVAERVIAYSQSDSEAETQILDPTPLSYEPPVGDGLWTYIEGEELAWFPYWKDVRTFVVSPEETSSTPFPFAYSENTSSNYYAQMNEIFEVATTARLENNEDLWIAEFWSDDVETLMMSPPGRQFSIAIQLIGQEDLSFEKSLELLLKLGFAMNDGAVSAWADKYEYNTERPNGYIQEFINADYETNLAKFITVPNPSFPSYPSGHAVFASAAAGVFIDQFGGNSINFTDRSHEGRTEFKGTSRTFSSFSEMAEENAYSRVPLGVHIRVDSDEGLRLGYEVSDRINSFSVSE